MDSLSVCGSGLRDPIAYSLLGGGVPYQEHRIDWSLDSVPMFKFLCFPSVNGFGPFLIPPPPRFSRVPCFPEHPARILSLFVLNASSPSVSVYSADPLLRLFTHRQSVGKLPTLRLTADQCPLLVRILSPFPR